MKHPIQMHPKPLNEKTLDFAKDKLAPFYQYIPAEKKPYLPEHSSHLGPYMACENGEGVDFMLDAASQIATLGLGFNAREFFGVLHRSSTWLGEHEQNPELCHVQQKFHEILERHLGHPAGLHLAQSGAEANEIALGMAYDHREHLQSREVIAFEGSFHGRMMVSLASTWGKEKREPFTLPGFESTFLPYPERDSSELNPPLPEHWGSFWFENGHLVASELKKHIPSSWLKDADIKQEIECLITFKEHIESQKYFATIIEPMQCEGGDRYASARFHMALLLLAKVHGVKIIYDEVQTGFHLGRSFFWHKQFDFSTSPLQPLTPDYVVCAKKAQVGLVLALSKPIKSPWIQETEFSTASLWRGFLHAQALAEGHAVIVGMEKEVTQQLEKLQKIFPEWILRPRACGLSFAFDLPEKAHADLLVSKRFDYGLLFYPAGTKTLRFRLNLAFERQDVAFLFKMLEKQITELLLNKPSSIAYQLPEKDWSKHQKILQENYEWHQQWLQLQLNSSKDLSITKKITHEWENFFKKQHLILERLTAKDLQRKTGFDFKAAINALEKEIYEPLRQTPWKKFEEAISHPLGQVWTIRHEDDPERLLALMATGPMHLFADERPLRQDADFNDETCHYVLDLTVHPKAQHLGLGQRLKLFVMSQLQKEGARLLKGRNRQVLAYKMWRLNLGLGALEEIYQREDYLDDAPHRDVHYYSLPLTWKAHAPHLSAGLKAPLGRDALTAMTNHPEEQLPLMGMLINKICLSNFTPLSFLEHLSSVFQLMPVELRHGYSTSGQSEAVDKIVKSLWYQNSSERQVRPKKLLTITGHEFGRGSFLARSLSGHQAYFPVTHLPSFPSSEEKSWWDLCEKELASQEYLAFFVEPLTQNTLKTLDLLTLKKIKSLCQKYHVSLVFNETASSFFRWDNNVFFASAHPEVTPDAAFVYGGSQAGMCFLKKEYYIEKPLMMISTWDGDEFSQWQFATACKKMITHKKAWEDDRVAFIKDLNQRFQLKLTREYGLLSDRIVPLPLKQMLTPMTCSSGETLYRLQPSWSAMKDYLALRKGTLL
jgi:4-aminobutyrate aminotransferase-like enzyme/GNAT superfamily N-acetyltransferase